MDRPRACCACYSEVLTLRRCPHSIPDSAINPLQYQGTTSNSSYLLHTNAGHVDAHRVLYQKFYTTIEQGDCLDDWHDHCLSERPLAEASLPMSGLKRRIPANQAHDLATRPPVMVATSLDADSMCKEILKSHATDATSFITSTLFNRQSTLVGLRAASPCIP